MRRSFLTRRFGAHSGSDRFAAAGTAMAWRGPDGLESVEAGDWHLAVARLAITGSTPQPLWSADRQRVIAFNGTVTSAAEERARLDPRTDNDAELALLRLASAGAEGLRETCGHYALAVLEPAMDRLWLARDPEGEKPLFLVRERGRLVAFASTLASLRPLGIQVGWQPAEAARFFRFGFDRGPECLEPELTLDAGLRGVLECGPDDEVVGACSGSPDRERVAQLVSEPVVQPVAQPVAQSVSEGVAESVAQPVVEPAVAAVPENVGEDSVSLSGVPPAAVPPAAVPSAAVPPTASVSLPSASLPSKAQPSPAVSGAAVPSAGALPRGGPHSKSPSSVVPGAPTKPSGAVLDPRTHGELPLDPDPSPFRNRVLQAVHRCATAEVPVALSLSGGVDSACIAAALRELDVPQPCYQFQARGVDVTERGWAERIAEHLGLELRHVTVGPEILAALPDLTRAAGRPLGDPSVLAVHALARAAAVDGVRVLLGGEGADELFLGYRRQRALHRLPRFRLPGGSLVSQTGMGTGARSLRAATASMPYASLLEAAPPGFRRAVLAETFRRGALPRVDAAPRRLEYGVMVDREVYLRHDLLPKLDTALMAAGIEGRCPFLDPDVVASAEAQRSAWHETVGKKPLREAFAGNLPAGLFDARKRGFGLPLDRWLREDDTLADLLREPKTYQRPHLRPAGLAKMLDRHRAGRVAVGHALYLIAAWEIYLRDQEQDR